MIERGFRNAGIRSTDDRWSNSWFDFLAQADGDAICLRNKITVPSDRDLLTHRLLPLFFPHRNRIATLRNLDENKSSPVIRHRDDVAPGRLRQTYSHADRYWLAVRREDGTDDVVVTSEMRVG